MVKGYPGSKAQAGVFQRIIGQMPPHSVYVEPFFGSGQIFWRKRRATSSIVIDRKPDLIAKAGAEAGVIAIPGDAISKLPALTEALPADALIYCDPPYPLSTRGRPGRSYYQARFPGDPDAEMTDDDHSRLLTILCGLKCNVMLSGYPCDLYSSHLRDWRCCRYQTRTRGRTVTECLWANFPEPELLHDWRYAGQNYRQRLYYNRMAKRWLAKLEALPARQRGFVLDAIEQRHFQRVAPVLSADADAVVRALAPESARRPGTEIVVKVREQHVFKEPEYWCECFLGSLKVFETARFTGNALHPMYDVQDWAARQGKTLRFDQTVV